MFLRDSYYPLCSVHSLLLCRRCLLRIIILEVTAVRNHNIWLTFTIKLSPISVRSTSISASLSRALDKCVTLSSIQCSEVHAVRFDRKQRLYAKMRGKKNNKIYKLNRNLRLVKLSNLSAKQ